MPGNKTHILVVDDSATIRRTIAKFLGDECITHEASDGEAALKLIETNKDIRLIYADMHMPVMNGMLLLNKIRNSSDERIASLPVIMITGHEDSNAARRASHNIGATDFISKPFDSFDILDSLETYALTSVSSIAPAKSTVATSKDKDSPAVPTPIDIKTDLPGRKRFFKQGEKVLQNNMVENSVLHMQIVGISEVFKQHGAKSTGQIVQSVAKHLSNSLRPDECLAHEGAGMFRLLMPGTNEFKANIVAIRIQKLISNLAFAKGTNAIRIKMAIGISSTRDNNTTLDITELCQQAEHALQLSLEHQKSAIIRYDETYEKRLGDERAHSEQNVKKISATTTTSTEINASDLNQYFPYILSGELDKIPTYYLEQMIEPMENLLDYAARQTTSNKKKAAGM